jgi:methyl-accepting chemotaxis protein
LRGTMKKSEQQLNITCDLTKEIAHTIMRGKQTTLLLDEAMKEINSSSQQISETIAGIDDIVFQMNLLALNAAVEAARAGEYGNGFSVISEEISVLAARSSQTAKDIKVVIQNTLAQVDKGMSRANSIGQTMQSIEMEISKVLQAMKDLNAMNENQKSDVEKTHQTTEFMNQNIQKNKIIIQQVDLVSKRLFDFTNQQKNLTKRFILP